MLKLQPTIKVFPSNRLIQIGSLEKSANSAQQLLLFNHLIYKPLLTHLGSEDTSALGSSSTSSTLVVQDKAKNEKILSLLNELQLGLQSYLKTKMRTGAPQNSASQYFLTPQEEMRQYEYLDDDRSTRLNEIFHDNQLNRGYGPDGKHENIPPIRKNFIFRKGYLEDEDNWEGCLKIL